VSSDLASPLSGTERGTGGEDNGREGQGVRTNARATITERLSAAVSLLTDGKWTSATGR
jgi:hypothetical protein